jgi:nitroimidazol reductase NimA-like FMN-containing flavoprotein (pyridoxamine 5'-phosphate oxidase superfamily)
MLNGGLVWVSRREGMAMDEATERQLREVMDGERFGVLATYAEGRLHTATIHFATTDRWELVHAIRPETLKAEQAAADPRVAFQVDNRGILLESRARFTRISLEGTLRQVPEGDAEYNRYRQAFADKLPVGEQLLTHPEIEMYVLTPSHIRLAVGASPAEEFELQIEPPAAETSRIDGGLWEPEGTEARDDGA